MKDAATPSIKRIVDEGLLIALSAVRMAVKNRIIVGALREHRDYDTAEYAAMAKDELNKLARQNREDARRVRRRRKQISHGWWVEPLSEDEMGDLRQLRQRRKMHRRLSDALRAVADDDEQVARLVENAQADAGQEVGAALTARLIARVDRHEPDYEERRVERTRDLVSDLAALISEKTAEPGSND